MLIYGSRAIKYHFNDFYREPKDYDYICKNPPKSTKETEYHWVDSFQWILDNNKDTKFVDPDIIYTIKMSHISWDINFDKHLKDILFLRDKGCKLIKPLYKALYKEWEVLHRNKHISLDKANSEFFTEYVTRQFNHDDLHEIFAFYDEPLHNRIRPDGNKALTSEKLFNSLSYDDRLKCALEEVYVIATERFLLTKSTFSIKIAKMKALRQLILTMTKGYFNVFLVENFDKIIYYDMSHFKNGLKQIGVESE